MVFIKTHKLIYLFALFVFLAILGHTLSNLETSDNPSESSVPAVQIEQTPKILQEPKNQKVQTIVASAKNLPGQWGIYIKDTKSENTYTLNPDKVFAAASIYKLAVMYMAYDAIESGQMKKTDVLSSQKTSLDEKIAGIQNPVIDPEAQTRRASPTPTQTDVIAYTVERALKLMVTISDNYSALLLAERLGWANIDKFMEDEGIPEINLVGPNSPNVTARSVGALLEKIYKKEAVSKSASEEMINLLLAQEKNDRIPKYLPIDIQVAHKTGELETIRNDAGIVYGKNGDYIFVFLTDTPDQIQSTEKIAALSKQIFDELDR